MSKIKVGVILDLSQLFAYEASMLEELYKNTHIDIHLIDRQTPIRKNPYLSNINYEIYHWLDKRIFGSKNDPFKIVNFLSTGIFTNHSDEELSDSDLVSRNYDLLILCASQISEFKKYQATARFGVLSYSPVEINPEHHALSGYWEVMEFKPDTPVTTYLSTSNELNQVIYQSHSTTDNVSSCRNREPMFWKAKSFVPRIIRQLDNDSIQNTLLKFVERNTDINTACFSPKEKMVDWRKQKSPNNYQAFKHLLFKIPGIFQYYWTVKTYWDQWFLLYRFSDSENIKISDLSPIYPPKDRIWADPHLYIREGRYYVFIEEMLFSENKGFISVLEIKPDGNHTQPVKVLEEPFHLSYPQIFEWENELYMIPESSSNKTVTLYRCEGFPNQWTQHKVLLENIDAVDTSILFVQGKWWLFCSVKPHLLASENDELHIYFSDELTSGNWTPHKRNPIISDVRRARPAGKIHYRSGQLVRPSQNCSRNYGFGLNLNVITLLSEDDYEEKAITCFNAHQRKGIIGVHTYTREDQLTVVDACRRIPKFLSLLK